MNKLPGCESRTTFRAGRPVSNEWCPWKLRRMRVRTLSFIRTDLYGVLFATGWRRCRFSEPLSSDLFFLLFSVPFFWFPFFFLFPVFCVPSVFSRFCVNFGTFSHEFIAMRCLASTVLILLRSRYAAVFIWPFSHGSFLTLPFRSSAGLCSFLSALLLWLSAPR